MNRVKLRFRVNNPGGPDVEEKWLAPGDCIQVYHGPQVDGQMDLTDDTLLESITILEIEAGKSQDTTP